VGTAGGEQNPVPHIRDQGEVDRISLLTRRLALGHERGFACLQIAHEEILTGAVIAAQVRELGDEGDVAAIA
jgi:hypothetical protein